MAPKKQTGKRRERDDEEGDNFGSVPVNVDPLIISQEDTSKIERPFTVSRFFKEKLNDGLGNLLEPDWSELKQRLAARKSSDKPWFIQVGCEEVGSEPAPGKFTGDVYKVQFCGIAEASSSDTLSPYTFVIREHRVHADIEDCQPEKLKNLEEHGFRWLEILADDLSRINCYLIVTASEATQLLEKERSFFSTNLPVKDWSKKEDASAEQSKPASTEDAAPGAAPTTSTNAFAGFGQQQNQNQNQDSSSSNNNVSNNNAFGSFGAGFGSSNNNNNNTDSTANFASGFGSATNNNNNNFAAGFGSGSSNNNNNNFASGFGAGFGGSSSSSSSQPSTTANNSFSAGFGAGFGSSNTQQPQQDAAEKKEQKPAAADAAAAAAAPQPDARTLAATASSGVPRDADDVQFQIFGKDSLKEIKETTSAGSKIVLVDLPLKDGNEWRKLKMENDLKDKVPTAVQEAIDKVFAKNNESMQALGEWIEECPEIDPHIIEPLTQLRARALKAAKSENPEEYEKIAQYKDELAAALKNVVEQRKNEISIEQKLIKRVEDDLKKKKIIPREAWKLYKFHPNNNVVKFRPHDKFRILGKVDECCPAAYDASANRQNNAFFKQ